MAEKVVSPGVFTNEIDASFLPSAIGDIGAALVGPTVKGPALVPTVVTSYSEFQQIFGDTFKSGSNYYSYLTSLTAQQYLKNSNYALLQLNVTEKSLEQITDILSKAKELAIAQSSDFYTQDVRKSVANEVHQLRNRLISISNKRIGNVR